MPLKQPEIAVGQRVSDRTMVDEEIELKKQLGGSDEDSERLVRRINSAPIRNWMWLSKRP